MEERREERMQLDKTKMEALIVRVQQGDQKAFEELYDITFPWVCSMVYRRLDAAYAEDCVQDIYLKLYEKAKSYDAAKGDFLAWFRSVVVNQATDNWRKLSRIQTMETSSVVQDDCGEYVEMEFEGNHFIPETENDRREAARSLKELLKGLNAEQTQAILLHYVHQKKDREIAEELGIAENTVKSRINKGIKRMARLGKSMRKDGYVFFGMMPIAFAIAAMTADPDTAYASMMPEKQIKRDVMRQLENQGAWTEHITKNVADSSATVGEMMSETGVSAKKTGWLSAAVWRGMTLGLTGMVVIGGVGLSAHLQNNRGLEPITVMTENAESSMEEEGMTTDEGTQEETTEEETTLEQTTEEETTQEETSAVEETTEEGTTEEETTKKETAAKTTKSTKAAKTTKKNSEADTSEKITENATIEKSTKKETAADETTAKASTQSAEETTAKASTQSAEETGDRFGSGMGW